MIIRSERDIMQIGCAADRRELRNYIRFLRLWRMHGFDMLERPRWQKYLGVTKPEAEAMQKNPPKWQPVNGWES